MIAAVLAGGRARRFGGDKLLYRIDGKPLIAHVIERLLRASEIKEVVVVASPDRVEPMRELGVDVIPDDLLVGPMGGVYTALSLGDVFVVAGDMPSVVPELVDDMVRTFRRSGKVACVPLWPNGYIEPLHSVYSSRLRPAIEERLERRDYSLNSLIRSVDACYVRIDGLPEEWRDSFFNVNTKRDLESWTK